MVLNNKTSPVEFLMKYEEAVYSGSELPWFPSAPKLKPFFAFLVG